MSHYQSIKKLHGYFAGILYLISFSAMAEEITFSDVTSLQDNDRYVVVLGSKPTDTTPSYVKQIQYDRIDINSIEAVTARSEGIHIDVAELQMGSNAELINKVYQAYELGLTMLYFDAHHDEKLTNFRNTFLAENFAAENSTLRLGMVFNNKLQSQKMLAVSQNQFNARPAAANSNACKKRGLLEAGQALNLLAAGAPYFRRFSGAAANPLIGPLIGANDQGGSAAASIFVFLDILAAVFNGSRLIACADHTNRMMSTNEVKHIADGVVAGYLIEAMMKSIKNIGRDLQRDLHLIAGKDATVNKQENWIKERLKDIRKLYATLQTIGYKASGLTADLAAIEIGLFKKLYKIHEESSPETKKRIKNELASKMSFPASYFIEQQEAFSAQEGWGKRGREEFLDNHKGRTVDKGTDCRWHPGPVRVCTSEYEAQWGMCNDKFDESFECYRKTFYSTDTSSMISASAQAEAHLYEHVTLFERRQLIPRKSRAVREYSDYFYNQVKNLKANEYPSLKVLLGTFSGFNLAENVSIFEHFDQRGYEITLGVGRYTLPQLLELGMRDNEISSLSVPEGLVVTAHQHENFNGWVQNYASDSNVKGWFDEHISSIEIKKMDAVTVYENLNQNVIDTQYGSFTDGYEVRLPVGHFILGELENRGIKDNDIASLHIPAGFTVRLFHDDFYRGPSKVYSGSTNLQSAHLNLASSVKIERVDVKNDFVSLRSLSGNGDYCLDADSSTAHQNGGKVGIWPCVANSDAQKWKYDSKGRFVNKLSGKCMIVRWNQQNTPATPVVVWDCTDSGNRKWALGHSGHNLVHNGGLCLDIPDNGPNKPGKQVEVYTCHDRNNQGWYFD